MKCFHCSVAFHEDSRLVYLGQDSEGHWACYLTDCPECGRFNIYFIRADIYYSNVHPAGYKINKDEEDNLKIDYAKLIRPEVATRNPVPTSVPEHIKSDYIEASAVLSISTKASAALSRRCLQVVLREAAKVKHADLFYEIQEVLDRKDLPTHISESIDAVRNIGNFGTHPIKSKVTNEIVEVEAGEADWNLDVLEMLFDFYYEQPEKIRKRKEALNERLKEHGKPPML